MLQDKKILIGITGSIAAYKSIYLVRALIKAGAEVKVIVTPAARDFVPTLTLSTLSKNPVLSDLFDEATWANHVMLGRWADLMLIAPLSCNTLSKMAHGACDNLLLATYLSATCPVMLAPAMDEDMWLHPATKHNLEILRQYGNHVIPVENGELASGLIGEGRMAEPDDIVEFVSEFLNRDSPLKGKKALVSAGPTYEALDPVRFIGNHSSGKMGIAIAEELKNRGAEVLLVLGPSSAQVNGLNVQRVESAKDMYEACKTAFINADITVMAAAVADYRPKIASEEKIKKQGEEGLTIEMEKTTDILKTLGENKKDGQILVGFALETNNEKKHAVEKLEKKNVDMIVLNSLRDAGAGFGHDTNKITIFKRNGAEIDFPMKSKKEVAKDIVDTIISLNAKR